MRKIILAFLTLLATQGFAQEWIDYMVDDNLTISLPANFTLMDTLGQRVMHARIDNALIMVQRIPNKGEEAVVVQFEADLIKAYEEFQNGIIRSQNGKLKSQEWVEISRVQLNKFSYQATMGEEKQLRHCLTLFINDYWYAIQFWEVESMTGDLASEREKLFTSVKLREGVSRENQTSDGNGNESTASAYYYVAIFIVVNVIVGIIGVVVLLILKIARRKKTNSQRTP